ncbi:penicillin-binding protein 1C [Maricaulis sp. W15]|uniref:penicillin-binding protein 1C n=1 Tax=Maricaulis sp. W15 TaxID=1772333 RepID=UPI0009489A52|nr:penicillin-binding protein 1C [Maricaulis sp. W15]OLF77735.1 penicillin-binding protein 1C [Maricaulis sp. W15]
MFGLGRAYWFILAPLVALVGLLALDRALPPPLPSPGAVSAVVRDRNGEVLRAFPVEEGRWRLAADLDQLDPDFVAALLVYEDERFFEHWGIDLPALVRAARDGVMAGRIVSGGSTITMQLARLIEPRERTFGAKLIQMARALQLELRLSKAEILELYLTLAPYGGNLEGVRAASWAYFGREPDDLTIDQIAMLIALPQSPEARRPDRRPDTAIRARGRVLDRLAAVGLARTTASADAVNDPAPTRRAFPAEAWHVAEALVAARPEVRNHVSTVDRALQFMLQDSLAAELPETGNDVQFAAIIIETESRAVRALAGSASRGRPGGWIDLTDRPRSPGSTLKPFIYGMAFDDGIAAPGTRIADLPRRFSGYQPDNFDRRFRGDVTIAEALQHSLNIPAVTTLDGVGARRFNAALGFAGASPLRPRQAGQDSGLAVALGGAGLTVRQVATLYAALGDGGAARPLVWFEDEASAPVGDEGAFQILSAESAAEILAVLRRAPHPGGRMPALLARGAPDIAFKTGTSYGFRDAWAAGVAGRYTIVVWSGRADGAPREGVTGRDVALPVLFRIADGISQSGPDAGMDVEGESDTLPDDTPQTLADFRQDRAPHILFPPDGAEVWSDHAGRGFILAAQAPGPLRWYADGRAVGHNALGEPVWVPPGPGFYLVSAVDERGRATEVSVRVRGAARRAQ